MRLALIAPTYLPARRANTVQVMKMAQAITALGHDVLVLVPGKDANISWEQLAHHYGLTLRFEITWITAKASMRSYDFGWLAVRRAKSWHADVIYSRLPQAAAVASFLGIPTILETHDFPGGLLGPWLFTRFLKGRGARCLVVITKALRDTLRETGLLSAKSLPVVIAPDGVDLARYKNLPSQEDTRRNLNIPDRFTVGYTGHLYAGRGIAQILKMAAQLPAMNFLLAGGNAADIERVDEQIKFDQLDNVMLLGFIPNAELPLYQAACDVLLMPYQKQVAASSGGDIAHYFSPMKLFEYLACGRAILSSDLPVLLEVLNPTNALLLPSDDIEAWVEALLLLHENPKQRDKLAAQAHHDAQQYSWQARAQKILESLI
ncbi:MAG: glycosyltransferase family 4 protein [Chloroflexi bacterium]|nr:glycosyltransferase family 4 protein [Chloroflexota bacterium]